jgi:hypothetical protein
MLSIVTLCQKEGLGANVFFSGIMLKYLINKNKKNVRGNMDD